MRHWSNFQNSFFKQYLHWMDFLVRLVTLVKRLYMRQHSQKQKFVFSHWYAIISMGIHWIIIFLWAFNVTSSGSYKYVICIISTNSIQVVWKVDEKNAKKPAKLYKFVFLAITNRSVPNKLHNDNCENWLISNPKGILQIPCVYTESRWYIHGTLTWLADYLIKLTYVVMACNLQIM